MPSSLTNGQLLRVAEEAAVQRTIPKIVAAVDAASPAARLRQAILKKAFKDKLVPPTTDRRTRLRPTRTHRAHASPERPCDTLKRAREPCDTTYFSTN